MRTLICESAWVFILVEGWPLFLGVEVFSLWGSLEYYLAWEARLFLIRSVGSKQTYARSVCHNLPPSPFWVTVW